MANALLDLIRAKSQTWTYAEIDASRTPNELTRDTIAANQYYMSATLRSFRIPDVRVLGSAFYGTVHSYCQLQSATGEVATLQSVTTPQQLQGADPKHVDRTIVQDIPLLGPVPFTGGNFTIQIGLFAVKEADLSGPYVSLLGTIASKAGVAYLSQAASLAQPILDGINGIVDSKIGGLQIGLFKGFNDPELPVQGYYAVVALPEQQISTNNLAINQSQRLVLNNTQQEVDAAYLVFTLERFTSRSDWPKIHDLKTSYANIRSVEQTKDKAKISDALTAFKVAVLSSPDLLDDDQTSIINNVEKEVNRFLTELTTTDNPAPLAALNELPIGGVAGNLTESANA